MTDAGFYRGTNSEQDSRFSDKNKKLIKQMKFSECLEEKVNMSKVNLDVLKPWITKRLCELLNFEDDVVIEFVFNQLMEKNVDPKLMQINLTGFLNAKNARIFMGDLWSLLLSAQQNIAGIPDEFIEQKKLELMQKHEEEAQSKIQKENDRAQKTQHYEERSKDRDVYQRRTPEKEHRTSNKRPHHHHHRRHHHGKEESPSHKESSSEASADDNQDRSSRRRQDEKRDYKRGHEKSNRECHKKHSTSQKHSKKNRDESAREVGSKSRKPRRKSRSPTSHSSSSTTSTGSSNYSESDSESTQNSGPSRSRSASKSSHRSTPDKKGRRKKDGENRQRRHAKNHHKEKNEETADVKETEDERRLRLKALQSLANHTELEIGQGVPTTERESRKLLSNNVEYTDNDYTHDHNMAE